MLKSPLRYLVLCFAVCVGTAFAGPQEEFDTIAAGILLDAVGQQVRPDDSHIPPDVLASDLMLMRVLLEMNPKIVIGSAAVIFTGQQFLASMLKNAEHPPGRSFNVRKTALELLAHVIETRPDIVPEALLERILTQSIAITESSDATSLRQTAERILIATYDRGPGGPAPISDFRLVHPLAFPSRLTINLDATADSLQKVDAYLRGADLFSEEENYKLSEQLQIRYDSANRLITQNFVKRLGILVPTDGRVIPPKVAIPALQMVTTLVRRYPENETVVDLVREALQQPINKASREMFGFRSAQPREAFIKAVVAGLRYDEKLKGSSEKGFAMVSDVLAKLPPTAESAEVHQAFLREAHDLFDGDETGLGTTSGALFRRDITHHALKCLVALQGKG